MSHNNALPTHRTTLHGPFVGFTLKTSTWVSNSHGLYDYESHNVSARTYRCHGRSNAYRILRKGVDVSLVEDSLGQELISEDSSIATIAKLTALEEGGYCVESSGPEEDRQIRSHYSRHHVAPLDAEQEAALKEESRFWIVVRSVKDGSIPLKDGDSIKLGRFAFNVKQVVLNTDQERKVNGRSGNDEDDVATCETRRSDTVANQPREFSGEAVELDQNRALSLFDYGSAEESSSSSSGSDICDLHAHAVLPSDDSRRATEVSLGQCRFAPPPIFRSDTASSSASVSSQLETRDEQLPPQHPPLLPAASALPLCRICLSEEEDPKEDPLVSPCKCNGSMKWIHLKCLRTWMEGRLNIKVDDVGSSCFFWRPLECELCQESYPTYVDISHKTAKEPDGETPDGPNPPESDPISRALRICSRPPANSNLVELFRIPKPAVPFMILESKHQPSGNVGYHFLSFSARDSARLGRGHEADVRVADISVSRLHATLRYQASSEALLNTLIDAQPGQPQAGAGLTPLRNPLGHVESAATLHKPYVYIEDLKSKFGTLIAVCKPIFLYPRMMLSIQVGRTVLTFYVRKPSWSRFIPSCFHVYYKGFISKCRRRRLHKASSRLPTGYDSHDVRLLETYLPLSLAVAGHEPSVIEHDTPDRPEGGDRMGPTAPLERALAPV